jgi:hypothetical protein
VLIRNLNTGLGMTCTVPECKTALQVQAAGLARLTAENANGSSTTDLVYWEEKIQYPELFTNFSYSIDPTTDAITVNWGWQQQDDTDTVSSYSVVAGNYEIDGLPPTATSTVLPCVAMGSSATRRSTERWPSPSRPPPASLLQSRTRRLPHPSTSC